MKRKLIIMMMILAFCFSAIGCSKEKKEETTKENPENKVNYMVKEPAELNEIDGVLMRIKKDTLTRTSATIVIYDYTNDDNIYGDSYHIDKKENGEWISLKTLDGKEWTEVPWNSMAYYVDEHDRLEMDIGWENTYGALPNGEYRIVKSTSKQGEIKNHNFSVQFVIES